MLDKSEVLAVVNSYARDAWGQEDSDLTNERAAALDHYYGRPYGDEQEGRSAVVSKDLAETVDWILPSLIKMFLASGRIVQFDPVGPEDEQLAEQETDYVNHVFLKENSGFLILHDLFKEALLLKNWYAKHYYEYEDKTSVEKYGGMTEDDLVRLATKIEEEGGSYEIIEQEELDPLVNPDGTLTQYFNVKLRVTRKVGKECVEAIPVEEVRVSKRTRGPIHLSDYCEHITTRTRTQLIEMGMGKEFVEGLAAHGESDTEDQRNSRNQFSQDDDRDTSIDRSMDLIEFREVYCKIDADEDGKAELRKIVIVGNKIPDGSEWNEEIDSIPLKSGQPKRMPHKHIGESIDDELSDLQRIKTTLTRQLLDNIYGVNNAEWLVNERVNLDDFLVSRPLGIKRVSGEGPVSDSAAPVRKDPIIDKVLPAIDYIDRVRSGRTGVSQANTSIDPDVLKKSTEGAFDKAVTLANAKVEMIGRMFAEGIKDLMLGIHADLIKYQDKPKLVRLRNQFVPIDTQEWRERDDLTINVGLGNGSQDEERANSQLLAMAVEKVAPFGLVGPKQAYNWFEDTAEALGKKNPARYVMDPESEEFKQAMEAKNKEQPNPLAEAEKIKAQASLQITQIKEQSKQQVETLKARLAQVKDAAKNSIELRKALMQYNIDIADLEVKAFIEGANIDLGQPGMGTELNDAP